MKERIGQRRFEMTIVYENKKDARARVRIRRRRIADARRNIPAVRTHRTLIIISICLIITFGGYFGVRGDWSAGAYAAEETVYKTVMVYQGDTIWGIASEYTESSKDVRAQVRAICEINDVSPGKIYPGQILLVPVPVHLM